MKIKELGEFGLIGEIQKRFPPGEGVVRGIGDDAAVLNFPGGGKSLLLATDSIVEGVHFMSTDGWDLIGRKALAVNLSDIAAMGGEPRWAVIGLGLPPNFPVESFREIYKGLEELAREFSVCIVGGDTFKSPDSVFLSVTVAGEVEPGNCVYRDGARSGDLVCLTGRLSGGSGDKHLHFVPRVKEGRCLGERFRPTAMIDISDGLWADLSRLCGSSSVGVRIDAASLPLADGAVPDASAEMIRRCGAGEEFELLFTIPPEKKERLLEKFFGETETEVSVIGEILPDPARREIKVGDGKTTVLPEKGYEHFRD